MEKVVYLIDLFDIYGELFTDKQKLYFVDYYFNNFTLQEISENYGITRNAIHKSLKETEEKLLYYEEKLKIYDKNKKILSLLSDNKELKERVEEML